MSYFDMTAEQRERARLPRYIARPPAPEHPGENASHDELKAYSSARYRWEHGWELHYDVPRGGFGRLVQQGWEVRNVRPGRPFDFDQPDEERRDEVARWADGFINGTGTPGLVWPEDREEVLSEVAGRLREATADGFLVRALESVASNREDGQ